MARREGRREAGLALLEDIHRWCPNRYQQMIAEHISNAERRPRN